MTVAPRVDPFAEWVGWRQVPGDALPIVWGRHAIIRYLERGRERPFMTPNGALRELMEMLPGAYVTRERPAWLGNEEDHDKASAYLMLADVCMPLGQRLNGELHTITAIVRGGIAPTYRGHLNRVRRQVMTNRRWERVDEERGRSNRDVKRDVRERDAERKRGA